MDRAFAKYLIGELKSELPIPPETCPIIDDVIKAIDDGRNRAARELLERVRRHNVDLRELGREWYQLADDLANQFPTRRTNCKS